MPQSTRVMPHADLIPEGMQDPDWGRAGVTHPGQLAAPGLGDPTRWGASINPMTFPPLAGRQVQQSGQIISAQCQDGYARNWSINGQLGYIAGADSLNDGKTVGVDFFAVILQCILGVGSNQVPHNFNLRAICAADFPFYYGTDGTFGGLINITNQLNRPFVMPGALVASMISMQVVVILQTAVALGFSVNVNCTLQISPMAPGKGL
jgi:hypothetical protein